LLPVVVEEEPLQITQVGVLVVVVQVVFFSPTQLPSARPQELPLGRVESGASVAVKPGDLEFQHPGRARFWIRSQLLGEVEEAPLCPITILLIPHIPVAPVVVVECITPAVKVQSVQMAPLAKVLVVDRETP